MYTVEAIRDTHGRTHRSLRKLLDHCSTLTAEELNRTLDGFGYPTAQLQLDHVIGAEEYWVSVIRGRYVDDGSVDDDGSRYPTIEALRTHRVEVAAITAEYLTEASATELNTAREVLTWPGKMRSLVPAHVLMRTQTHIYQHQGQVLAMCRLLGKPGPAGLDFPLD